MKLSRVNKMTLYSYLKQFKNIAWYPSAGKDALAMVCLSIKNLLPLDINKEDLPDCFIFTDYYTDSEGNNNHRFILDLADYESEAKFSYQSVDYEATAFNVKELKPLRIPLYEDMITGYPEYRYNGHVYVSDVLVDHPKYGKYIAKLVYVIAENTSFAINYLIKNKIKIKYAIHCRYGHGFGGGFSNGAYMFHILKDLGVEYFASDMDDGYNNDIADRYLKEEQKKYFPVLREITDFYSLYHWYGYDRMIFYKVVGYETNEDHKLNNRRFITTYES